MSIDWATLTVGIIIGWIVGVTVGTFVLSLMFAGREEQQKTGHDGPVEHWRKGY